MIWIILTKSFNVIRWSTKQYSLSALKRNIKYVYNVLKEMSEYPKLSKEVIVGTKQILKHLNFNFFFNYYY